MYPAYAKWIQSHRDLPLQLNQWNNVVVCIQPHYFVVVSVDHGCVAQAMGVQTATAISSNERVSVARGTLSLCY